MIGKQGCRRQIRETLPRLIYVLMLLVMAVLFGRISAPIGMTYYQGLRELASFGISRQMDISYLLLRVLLFACLIVLTMKQLYQIFWTYRCSSHWVLMAAIGISFTPLLYQPEDTFFVASWLMELLFAFFAAQSLLQLALLPSDKMRWNVSPNTMLFLLLIGAFTLPGFFQGVGKPWELGGLLVYGVLVIMALVLYLFCRGKQGTIRLLEMTLDDSSMTDSLKMALGSEGIQQLLPYISRQMSQGTSIAKLLLLEMMRGVEFAQKEDLVKAAFDTGSLEVRFSIVDQVFKWNLPYGLLAHIADGCDAALAEYFIRALFVNCVDLVEHGVLEELQERAEILRPYAQSEQFRRMFGYVFEGRREDYPRIIGGLLGSDRKEDRLFACEIMVGFIGREDAVNRRYLAAVIKGIDLNPVELDEIIQISAEYDNDFSFLKNGLCNVYSYPFLKKICRFYEPLGIVKSLSIIPYPIPMALTLCAASHLDRGSIGIYQSKADQLIGYLFHLRDEESRMERSGYLGVGLLLEETKRLRLALLAALLDYLLFLEAGIKMDNLNEMLDEAFTKGEIRPLLAALSAETRAALEELFSVGSLAGRPPQPGPVYSVLRVSENNALLEWIYRYVGGETMDTQLTDNIEKLITLKSIPMFSELDVFTLQQIQKIAGYKKIPAGETIIREGEEGASLYIVINGSVGVYKGDKLINEIGMGGLFGEMAVIEKQRRSATVKTLAETSFLTIEGDDFIQLLQRNSSISGSVIRTLAGRLRKMLEAGQQG